MSMVGLIRSHELTPENVAMMKLNDGTKTGECESCRCKTKKYVSGFSSFACCKSCFGLLQDEIKKPWYTK